MNNKAAVKNMVDTIMEAHMSTVFKTLLTIHVQIKTIFSIVWSICY